MSAHTNSSLRTQSVPLRVLIMGRANAGKTTILKKICYSSENPQIFTPDGKEINLSVVEGSVGRGLHDIENQLIFKSNPQFIFHDSRGFESGSVEETEKVRAFIAKRAASTNLSDQLHAIWYCLPTDTNRPLMESDKQFFNTHVAGKVPVIAIFTKFDALLFEASCQLEDEGIDREEARHRSTKHADKILTTNFINPLMSTAFPPSDYVRLADMHMADSNCNELLEKTANALSDDRRSSLSVPVREIKIDLSTQNAMRNKTPELFPDKPTQPVTILDQFPRLRVLAVGKYGTGKSTLIAHAFRVNTPEISYKTPGLHDINTEITFAQNPHFVLHDSRGFEPGESAHFARVKEFLESRSGERVALKDRLHVIWLCIQVPYAGSRVFETGDEALLHLASTLNIPVVVVFTQFDRLIERVEYELNDEECDISEGEISKLSEAKADSIFRDVCVVPLNRLAPMAPYARTSLNRRHHWQSRHQSGVAQLIHITHSLVDSDVKGVVQTAFLFARQITASMEIGASTDTVVGITEHMPGVAWPKSLAEVDVKKYLQDAASTTNSFSRTLQTIHFEITKRWNSNDPGNLLNSSDFMHQIKALAQMLTPDVSALESWFTRLEDIYSLTGVKTAFTTAAAPTLEDIGLSPVFEGWFASAKKTAPEVWRFLTGYIVDLDYIMEQLSLTFDTDQPSTMISRDRINSAVEQYKTLKAAKVHVDIRTCVDAATGQLNKTKEKEQEAIGHDFIDGHGPRLYKTASVATSIIYWPEKKHGVSTAETDSTPKPSVGLEEFMEHYPNGGAILSVHQPAKSSSWLEENYELQILEDIRNSGRYSGPLPMLLFPEVSALAIFGPHSEDKMAKLAQRLADKSNFPVISRPSADDPILRFTSLLGTDKTETFDKSFSVEPVVAMIADGNSDIRNTPGLQRRDSTRRTGVSDQAGTSSAHDRNTNRDHPGETQGLQSTDDATHDPQGYSIPGNVIPAGVDRNPSGGGTPPDDDDGIPPRSEVTTPGPEVRPPGGQGIPAGGGHGPGGEGASSVSDADKWKDWASPIHLTKLEVNFTTNNLTTTLDVTCQTQFKTYADGNAPVDAIRAGPEPSLLRPQAQVHTELTVDFSTEEVFLDRSFAVLGLLPHRGDSIFKSTNLDAGFSPPTYTYTFSKADNSQNTFGATAMLSPHPTGAVTATHTSGNTVTTTAVATKPMPPADLEHKRGEHYSNKKEKSYDSRNYSYTANRDSPNGKPQAQSPLFVRFAFGINFFPIDAQRNPVQPPKTSCVSRNQIFIWVQDHTLRSKVRGYVLLFSSIVPDIRRESVISRSESVTINSHSNTVSDKETSQGLHEDGASLFGFTPTIPKKSKTVFENAEKRSTLRKIRTWAGKVLGKFKSTSLQVTLAPQEIVSRGWDSENSQWRNPIYPELDKHCRIPEKSDSSLVAYKISPFPIIV